MSLHSSRVTPPVSPHEKGLPPNYALERSVTALSERAKTTGMVASRVMSNLLRLLGVLIGAALVAVGYVYAASEWKMRRSYEAPLHALRVPAVVDLEEGRRMARIVGCWAGCHGKEGEGGVEFIKGIHRNTAPTLSQVFARIQRRGTGAPDSLWREAAGRPKRHRNDFGQRSGRWATRTLPTSSPTCARSRSGRRFRANSSSSSGAAWRLPQANGAFPQSR